MIINPSTGGSGGGGGGGDDMSVGGEPRALLYENSVGTSHESDRRLIAQGLDPAGNPTLQDSRTNGAQGPRHRLGAWTGDGDAENRPAAGWVAYGPEVAPPFAFDANNASIVRVSPTTVVLSQRVAGLNVDRVELHADRGLTLRSNAGGLTLRLDRSGTAQVEQVKFGGGGLVLDLFGMGTPGGVVVADRGSTFRRTDGGPGTTLFLKEADDGAATGWTPVSSGGGGIPAGAPNGAMFYDPTGVAMVSDLRLTLGNLDPFQRPQYHDARLGPTARGPVVRLGSWGMDGDTENRTSEGFVSYGPNAVNPPDPNAGGPAADRGGMGFYTPNSWGTLQVIPGVNGGNPFYSGGYEDGGPGAPFGENGFVVRDNLAAIIGNIRRSDGRSWFRDLRFGGPNYASARGGIPGSGPLTGQPERSVTGSPADTYYTPGGSMFVKDTGTSSSNGWGAFCQEPGLPAAGRFELGYLPSPGDWLSIDDPLIAPAPTLVTYEWNASNPPVGGTLGAVWLYQGASVAEAQTILGLALDGLPDPRIAYNGVVLPLTVRNPYIPAPNTFIVHTATAAGAHDYAPRLPPSESLTFGAFTLAGPPNLWTTAGSYGERMPAPRRVAHYQRTIETHEAGSAAVFFPTPFTCAGGLATVAGGGPMAQCNAVASGLVVNATGVLAGAVLYVEAWGV